MAISFEEARAIVLREARPITAIESTPLDQADGRILAAAIVADRDYPPFDRSARDGFAVRAADIPGSLHVIGEIRAGDIPTQFVGAGEAIEIMTGAPMPAGADAVVMVEHTTRNGEQVTIDRHAKPGDNYTPRGNEARGGVTLIEARQHLGYAEIALLAMAGCFDVPVFRQPRVAILPTGDEIVDAGQTPTDFQIRNSNAWSLAAQVRRAGGVANVLPIARDEYDATRSLIVRGLAEADVLLLSGGVSAGKYDIVEKVLADLGAKFFFDRVAIQPGQPVVFGSVNGKLFFGLPGNPISTMVTFELFARAAIDETPLRLMRARLTREFRHKTGLTRFLPAMLSEDGASVTPVPWHGSGDLPALARANAFLVADADRESWNEGEEIRVMLR